MNEKEFYEHFLEAMKTLKVSLPRVITKDMEAHDYQNCLCESYKYYKALTGVGRPKQLFRGG